MADQTLTIEVPADDGAIQRAFEELDARMDAWLSVMHRIEQVLRSGVGTCVAETVGDAVAAAVASAGEAVDEVAVDSASDEQAGADTEVQKDTGRESGGRRAAAVVVDVSAPSAASEPATGCVAGPLASSAADAAPPTVQWTDLETAAVNRDADDEGLLATLDEETAKAIRVMRRLMLNRKSVRELLAEYQSKKSGTAAKVSTKKSWWHRGK